LRIFGSAEFFRQSAFAVKKLNAHENNSLGGLGACGIVRCVRTGTQFSAGEPIELARLSMSAPESQPADRTSGSESAESPPVRGERADDDDFCSLACTKVYSPNGDVLYCYSPADNGGDTLWGADVAGDVSFPQDPCNDKNERTDKREADANKPAHDAGLGRSFQ
jgi:hypothetical protein